MALRIGDRDQLRLFAQSIEETVSQDDPVRAFDAIVDALDPVKMGLYIDSKKVGNPSYNPLVMLKLLVYSYSYGWRSSRKIERATHHNITFMWLMGGMKPDHKTIANFRKKNKKVLKNMLKEVAKVCIKLELIEGNTLFLDGTKMRGACSISKTYKKDKLERLLEHADKNIDDILKECMRIDNKESGSFIKMREDLNNKENLKNKITDALATIQKNDLEKINITDNDAINFKGRQGSHAGYNAQVVTDEKHGMIVSASVVAEGNDFNLFSQEISAANEVLENDCKIAVADAGYSSVLDLKKSLDDTLDVIVPNQKQALHNPKPLGDFDREKFIYDEKKDCYMCPLGKTLSKKKLREEKALVEYRTPDKLTCINCQEFGNCTTSKDGRTVTRHVEEKLKEQLAERYDSESGKEIYARRKEVAELPFGHIKRNLNGGYFLVRGIEAVNAEFSLLASCFNMTRMISLLGGVSSIVNKLKLI